ncbi:MAG: SsrA-binding protein SmpB [Gammaproteobacteria bacterium]|jgi:SsrA-binding protein|nr:SsrA-binding protein SmpB [Gammaproteobacteria bacterium]
MAKTKPKSTSSTIALNKRARHDYHLEERFEAGLALEGWEVKALREGKGQLVDSYVLIKDGEAFLLGANITPLPSASSHVIPDPQRTRKLLLHASEISKIYVATQQKGYTCVATALYWKGQRVKCEVALAKGKKQHDKRADVKAREWSRQRERILKDAG